MEQSTINLLSPYMPMVRRYESQFASLNTLLSKTTLTGKISSLDIAENLFDYMEKTQEKFENLQDKLIQTIMEQNFLNAYEEAETSIKIMAQTLNFYFKNRHEDIAALAKSQYLLEESINYQNNKENDADAAKAALESIMDYVYKFGTSGDVYKSVLIYDNDGNLLRAVLNKSGENLAQKTKIPAVLEASGIELYGEFYQKADFYAKKLSDHDDNLEFFFVIPLRQSKELSPTLSLVFVIDLNEEFKKLQNSFVYRLPQSNLVVLNTKSNVLFSDNVKMFPKGQFIALNKYDNYTFLENRSKICLVAMMDIGTFSGATSLVQDWKICRIVPLYVAFDAKRQQNYNIDEQLLENSLLITEDLDSVIAEGENINEELGDVVINGEIIASKSHSYALNPILNNIRILSDEMNTLCIQSTEELQKGIYNALFNVVGYYAQYSTLVVDNVFKECIKDSIWIKSAMHFRRYFKQLIKEGSVAGDTLENTKALLSRLGENYENFHNILLLDRAGNVLQNALDDALINGKKLELAERLGGSAEVIVSSFIPSPFYNNKNTLVFCSGVKDENQQLIGGVAYVLDLERVSYILAEALPKESSILSEKSEIFSAVFDNQKNIIASTKDDFSFDIFDDSNEFDLKNLKDSKKIIKLGQKYYLLCVYLLDNGVFVEYTRRQLYGLICVAVKEDSIAEYVEA